MNKCLHKRTVKHYETIRCKDCCEIVIPKKCVCKDKEKYFGLGKKDKCFRCGGEL